MLLPEYGGEARDWLAALGRSGLNFFLRKELFAVIGGRRGRSKVVPSTIAGYYIFRRRWPFPLPWQDP